MHIYWRYILQICILSGALIYIPLLFLLMRWPPHLLIYILFNHSVFTLNSFLGDNSTNCQKIQVEDIITCYIDAGFECILWLFLYNRSKAKSMNPYSSYRSAWNSHKFAHYKLLFFPDILNIHYFLSQWWPWGIPHYYKLISEIISNWEIYFSGYRGRQAEDFPEWCMELRLYLSVLLLFFRCV